MEISQLTVKDLHKMGGVLDEQLRKLEAKCLMTDMLTTQNIMLTQLNNDVFYQGVHRKQVTDFLDHLHLSLQEMTAKIDTITFMLLNCTDKRELDAIKEAKEL